MSAQSGTLQVALGDGTPMGNLYNGLSNDMAKMIHRNPETVIGSVVEVRHYGVTKNGLPKFPTFIRWRDDKPAAECTADQFEL